MEVNIIVLPLVVSAVLLSMLGIYYTTTNLEYSMVNHSMDSIAELAERSNEILYVKITNSTILVQSHSTKDSEIFLIDFVLNTGEKKRVIYSDDNSFDVDTPIHEIRKSSVDAPTISAGARQDITLSDIGIIQSEISSASILTESGNRFLVDLPHTQSQNNSTTNTGDSTGNGEDGHAMINGMGINSRIIQTNFDETIIIHGTGMEGIHESAKPYTQPISGTDFAALVKSSDAEVLCGIPEFFKSYEYDDDDGCTLIDITPEKPNILGYSNSANMSGDNTIEIPDEQGITVSGTGVIVMRPNYIPHDIIIRGTLDNADVKIVTSPIDLTTSSMSGDNFVLYQDTSPSQQITLTENHWHSYNCRGGCSPNGYNHLHHTWDMVSNLNLVVAQDSDLSGLYNASFTCVGIVRGSPCHSSGMASHPRCYYSACYNSHAHSFSTLGESVLETIPVDNGILVSKITTGGNQPIYPSSGIKTHTLYSSAPWVERYHYTNSFEQKISLPADSYIVITLDGGTATIKGESLSENPHLLNLQRVPENIPYQIVKDGHTLVSGMSNEMGQIIIDEINDAPSTVGGVLHMYPDSLAYRGDFSTVIFDELNSEIIHIPTNDFVYTTHAYAAIPVTGGITVTNLSLDETLPIPYLDKVYLDGDTIHVPVLPLYDTIHLEINGIDTSLQYSNILGGTGITIADTTISVITKNDPSSPIHLAEAKAGTVAYAIASSEGTLKAIISETISGRITITNTYHLEETPPPPPPLTRIDPLTGEVDIYINGILEQQITLGVNPYPDFAEDSTGGLVVTQSVSYTYPDYTLSGATSIPVQAGDFVEFYVYAKIYGQIDPYQTPSGHVLLSSSGVSSATAQIRSAYITTDM